MTAAIPMEVPVELPDATRSGKAKMAASNIEYLYLSLCTRQQRIINGCTHAFRVQNSNGTSADIVQPNRQWIIQDGGLKTVNATSSAPRLDKYEIPTATATKLMY